MEQRASIPPGLPRPNPTVSYWQYPPSSLAAHRTTPSLPSATSIVIIGSGITGASLAYHLLNQSSSPSVLMLEARTACSGATGRNGGHTKHASYRAFMDNMRTHGEAEAAKIARFEYSGMKAVHAFARENNIDCDSWEGDTVDIFYDEGQWNKAKKAVAEIRRVLGTKDPAARYIFWDAVEAEQKFLAVGTVGAVSYEAGSLSAYKFAIGMLQIAVEKGLNLQTQTPALAINRHEEEQSKWIIQTPRGEVQAAQVLLATNGYTAFLYPRLQQIIVPLRGHMTVQRSGNALFETGLTGTYSFIYDNGYEYMIPLPRGSTSAGDIAIGGGLTKAVAGGLYEFGTTDDTILDPVIIDFLRESAAGYFGSNWGNDNPEGRIRNAWTGIMGYSADGFPLIGQIPNVDGLYLAAAFQGLGMVLCFSSAKALVRIMNDEDETQLSNWFPTAFRMTEDRMNDRFVQTSCQSVPTN